MIITSTTRAASRAKTRSCSSDFPPPDFNAAACPILATHWFDRRPEVATQRRYRRQVEHLHRLGPRAVGEILREVADGENLGNALEAYGRLTPDLLKALGGDCFPATPIYQVVP